MTNEKRRFMLEKIKSRISTFGYHVTIVQGGPLPRFAYTIGLYEKLRAELVFAGGSFFTLDEILRVIKTFAQFEISEGTSHEVDGLGNFSLQNIDKSWEEKLLLGALDYYGVDFIKSFQIRPEPKHWTIEIPNMNATMNLEEQPIWKWLELPWEYPTSSKSTAITNLDALRGNPVTEVMRWEDAEWELFAGTGPDTDKKDIRIVPLGTMIGYDVTLETITSLTVGSGIWREGKGFE